MDIESLADSNKNSNDSDTFVGLSTLHVKVKSIVNDLINWKPPIDDKEKLDKALIVCRKKYKYIASKREMLDILMNKDFENENINGEIVTDSIITTLGESVKEAKYHRIDRIVHLKNLLIIRAVRSQSGIINISVSMSPFPKGSTGPFDEKTALFSCKFNCHFCPNQPGMPRSYLSNEDVFLRAAEVEFDTVKQIHNRLTVLKNNGHTIDKLEYRVLSGSFCSYDHSVADEFIRDVYYAANIFNDYIDKKDLRSPLSIEEEQVINVTSKVHIVGLGIETRPDTINYDEILRFRRYGVTRVELGIQHTDDALLRKVNRGHGVRQSKLAIKLLKDYGFKIEAHIMTDLPGATPEGDKECYNQVLQTDPDLFPDYMKDYPCLDVSYTKIKEWKQQGLWKPYAERNNGRELIDVLIHRQKITPKWVRVNRIQRDFRQVKDLPGHHIGFTSETLMSNLSQVVKDEAEKLGIYCKCIRCCEVRNQKIDPSLIEYKITTVYPEEYSVKNNAYEYFVSAEISSEIGTGEQEPKVPTSDRHVMLGFLRLRIGKALNNSIIPELRGNTAMVRELHIVGVVNQVGTKNNSSAQHMGIGKKLLKMAEEIASASSFSCTKIAVISGIGVRDYYRKNGYELRGTYMVKELTPLIPDVIDTKDLSLIDPNESKKLLLVSNPDTEGVKNLSLIDSGVIDAKDLLFAVNPDESKDLSKIDPGVTDAKSFSNKNMGIIILIFFIFTTLSSALLLIF
jgi:ELP3 family radical SAM enzyme/protein acetyltransferase